MKLHPDRHPIILAAYHAAYPAWWDGPTDDIEDTNTHDDEYWQQARYR